MAHLQIPEDGGLYTRTIPTSSIQVAPTYKDTTVYTECTICMEPKGEEEYLVLKPCGHSGFCASCLKNLKETTDRVPCPRCRKKTLIEEGCTVFDLLAALKNKEYMNGLNGRLLFRMADGMCFDFYVMNGAIMMYGENFICRNVVVMYLSDASGTRKIPVSLVNGKYVIE